MLCTLIMLIALFTVYENIIGEKKINNCLVHYQNVNFSNIAIFSIAYKQTITVPSGKQSKIYKNFIGIW